MDICPGERNLRDICGSTKVIGQCMQRESSWRALLSGRTIRMLKHEERLPMPFDTKKRFYMGYHRCNVGADKWIDVGLYTVLRIRVAGRHALLRIQSYDPMDSCESPSVDY